MKIRRTMLAAVTLTLTTAASLHAAGIAAAAPEPAAAAFFHAVVEGDVAAVTVMLEKSPDLVRVRDEGEKSALHLAASNGNSALAELLLKNGAAVDARDSHDNTPLRFAVRRKDRPMIELLLAYWANINEDSHAIDHRSAGRRTLIQEAIDQRDVSFARFLLERGAAVDGYIADTMILQDAVATGDRAMVEMLASFGANVSSGVDEGRGPLDIAVERGDTAVAEVLLNYGAPANYADHDGRRPLDRAEAAGNQAMVKLLESFGAFSGKTIETLFATIAREGTGEEILVMPGRVRDFLRAHPELIDLQHNGDTPLHAAIKSGNFLMIGAILECAPDPNVADREDCTPFFRAVSAFPPELRPMLEKMFDLGADVNTRNGSKQVTALWAAVVQKDTSLVRWLLQRGASARVANADGTTLLHCVISQGDEPETVALLASGGADLGAIDPVLGWTPLLHAIMADRPQSLAALAQAGANPNATGGRNTPTQGITPLIAAIMKGKVELVRVLIEARANVNQAIDGGMTPLHVAAQRGHVDIVFKLLAAGASVDARAANGKTPYDVATNEVVRAALATHGLRTGNPSANTRP